MACANPYSLDLAIDDAAFASALREADLLVPDGVGMLIAGRILGKRFAERVVGMDFFTAVQAGLRCGR
jgi:N-acetylglucosaminyldiphosphoundecaprenol N-acetyl-beta-D-mannosaminyltransferase